MTLETKPELIESESVKPASIQYSDYVNLMKTNSDVSTSLPAPPAEKNLPDLVTEDSGHKNRGREGCDFVSLQPISNEKDSVDILMKTLGISPDQQTDPVLMKDILHNDMKLDDCPAVMKLLGSKLTEKESMKPMLETIRASIITKQPEMHEFISTALKENLIPSPDEAGQKVINRSLNHMVLLDAITKGMVDDYHVCDEIRNHLLNKRKEMGIRDDFLGSTYDMYKAWGAVFGPVKTKTMDMAFDQLNDLRKKGHSDEHDSQIIKALLELNIAEAIVKDKFDGFPNNARAGFDLALHPFSKTWVKDNNGPVGIDLKQDWISLYSSWNMDFMTGNLTNPQLLFPKLLIPQVIDAKPEDFLYNRALALWLTCNFQLFHKIDKKETTVIPGSKEIAKRWGEINESYGRSIYEK